MESRNRRSLAELVLLYRLWYDSRIWYDSTIWYDNIAIYRELNLADLVLLGMKQATLTATDVQTPTLDLL